jgi:hypothetical protein
MEFTLSDLLDANGYTLGVKKNIRKKSFREMLAKIPPEKIREATANTKSFGSLIRRLGLGKSSSPGNVAILIDALEYWRIDYSHIRPRGIRKYRGHAIDKNMLPEEVVAEFFSEDPPRKLSWPTMLRMIRDHNLLPSQCSECGIFSKWNGKELTLHVDHINGVNSDNRIENLRCLCPNCHSQTATYGSRNKNTPSMSALIEAKKV